MEIYISTFYHRCLRVLTRNPDVVYQKHQCSKVFLTKYKARSSDEQRGRTVVKTLEIYISTFYHRCLRVLTRKPDVVYRKHQCSKAFLTKYKARSSDEQRGRTVVKTLEIYISTFYHRCLRVLTRKPDVVYRKHQCSKAFLTKYKARSSDE